jgi:hypothetical protein
VDVSPFFDDRYFNHVIVQDGEWNGWDIKAKLKVVFGSQKNPQWKKPSKNADNRLTKYHIDGASLNLSIGSADDLNDSQNYQKYRAGLDILSDLILDSDDNAEEEPPQYDPPATHSKPMEEYMIENSAQTVLPLAQLQQEDRSGYLGKLKDLRLSIEQRTLKLSQMTQQLSRQSTDLVNLRAQCQREQEEAAAELEN